MGVVDRHRRPNGAAIDQISDRSHGSATGFLPGNPNQPLLAGKHLADVRDVKGPDGRINHRSQAEVHLQCRIRHDLLANQKVGMPQLGGRLAKARLEQVIGPVVRRGRCTRWTDIAAKDRYRTRLEGTDNPGDRVRGGMVEPVLKGERRDRIGHLGDSGERRERA